MGIRNQQKISSLGIVPGIRLALNPFAQQVGSARILRNFVPERGRLARKGFSPDFTSRNLFSNTGFDSWSGSTLEGWTDGGQSGGSEETSLVVSGSAYKITGDGAPSSKGGKSQEANVIIEANTLYDVSIRAQRTSGLSTGKLNIELNGTSVDTSGLIVDASTLTTSYAEYTDELTDGGLSTIPSNLKMRIFTTGGLENGESIIIDDLKITKRVTTWHTINFRYTRSNAPENEEIIFRSDGTDNQLVLDTSGKVGIGTASPDSKLKVVETDDTAVNITFDGTGSDLDIGLRVNIDNANTDVVLFLTADDGAIASGSDFIRVEDGGVERFIVDGEGQVSIGRDILANYALIVS
ncbi:hypothetical protein LCGC14_2544720, partial [marine sediment metagenome]